MFMAKHKAAAAHLTCVQRRLREIRGIRGIRGMFSADSDCALEWGLKCMTRCRQAHTHICCSRSVQWLLLLLF